MWRKGGGMPRRKGCTPGNTGDYINVMGVVVVVMALPSVYIKGER